MHRRVSGALLGERITTEYADTTGTNLVTRPMRWLTDKARWRDVGFLWFSATGGFVMSLLPVALLTAPVTHLLGALIDGGAWWWLLVLLDGPMLVGLVVRDSGAGPRPGAGRAQHPRVRPRRAARAPGRGGRRVP